MKINYKETSTTMSLDNMLKTLFPKQIKYREITKTILELFIEKGKLVEGRSEIEVESIVRQLESKGHNRNTVYKVLREFLVPTGIVNWKRFEGSIQLSKRFGNSLRRLSISWNNLIYDIERGRGKQID